MAASAASRCPSDEELAAWIGGRLSVQARDKLVRHFRDCSACSELVTQYAVSWPLRSGTRSETPPSSDSTEVPATAPKSGYRLAAGTALDRFVLLHPVGSGGMGEVYAAYDSKLDRKVALKLLRRDRDAYARARLLREARAMAKVTHPNVVTVHEVGTAADRDFVAMEFVEGTSVENWLDTRPALSEVQSVFRQAGRGLAAAHHARLIHRDFKPANVLLGTDGRARVTDFGLARRIGHEAAASLGSRDLSIGETLTQTGAAVGTPAYMAPEQYQGRDVSARSDQFSFCVAFYEALYGARPFSGETALEIQQRILRGDVDPPPADARVPSWIRRVLLRGLRAAPKERYPSMDALLAELDKDPAMMRRRRLSQAGVAAGMAAVVGLAIFAFLRGQGPAALCQAAGHKLRGVWDEEVKQAIKAGFLATGRPYAEDTFGRVVRVIDRQAASWLSMRTEACEATHVRHEQSDRLLDLRMQCLDRRLGELAAITTLFAKKADGLVVDKAVEVASKLKNLDYCADAEALQSAYPPPESPRTRQKVERLEKLVDEADALEQAGKYREGLEIVDGLTERVRTLDYPPLHAKTFYLRGRFLSETGDATAAESAFHEAARAAATANDDATVSAAWIELVWVLGFLESGRDQEALGLRRFVEVAIVQAGRDELLRARLFNHLGVIRMKRGEYEQARRHYEQALSIRTRRLGTHHPEVAHSLITLGSVLWNLGRYPAARQHYEQAAGILEQTLGRHHPLLAYALTGVGVAAGEQENYDEARQDFERALAIWEKALGRDHSNVAMCLANIGELLFRQGKYGQARNYLERSLAVREKTLGPDHPALAYPLTTLGKIALARRHASAALIPLQRALAIRATDDASTPPLAETQFALARALWDAKQDQRRSIALAQKARDIFASLGEGREKERVEVEQWLAQRSP